MDTSIKIIKGNILNHKVDCIVNSACKSMQADFGTVNKQLFEVANAKFANDSKALAPLEMNKPRIIPIEGMCFKYVMHVLVPEYRNNDNDYINIYNTYYAVFDCAKDNEITRISVPTLGMGGKRFPKEIAVKACFDAVSKWKKANNSYELDITVFCYDDDSFSVYKKYQKYYTKMSQSVSYFDYNDMSMVYNFLEYCIKLPPQNWKFSTRIFIQGISDVTEFQQLKYDDGNVKLCVSMQVSNKNNNEIIKSVMVDYSDKIENKITYYSPHGRLYKEGHKLYDMLKQLVQERPRYKYSMLDKKMILKNGIKKFILDESSTGILKFKMHTVDDNMLYVSDYLDGNISLGYDDIDDARQDRFEKAYIEIHIGDYLDIFANGIIDKELYTCITGKSFVKRLQAKDVIIRTTNKNCIDVNHKLTELLAYVPVFVMNNGLQQFSVKAYYCESCQRYYILENTYKSLKVRGLICCRVIDSKDLKSNKFSNWNTEHIIRQYGYNVNVNENLSEKQRHIILEFIIHNNILSRTEVIEHISWLIRSNIDRARYKDAVRKWTNDLKYLKGNNPVVAPDNVIVYTFWKK